jgi:hypothetical protein
MMIGTFSAVAFIWVAAVAAVAVNTKSPSNGAANGFVAMIFLFNAVYAFGSELFLDDLVARPGLTAYHYLQSHPFKLCSQSKSFPSRCAARAWHFPTCASKPPC